ncbi:MAG: DUF433 domain-containing protein [Tepidiformaceae bacterium]
MPLPTTAEPVPFLIDAHGVARVGGSRVPLETIVGGFKRGRSAEELDEAFPSVGLAAIYATISYYLHHTEAVEDYLRQAERDGELAEARHRDKFADQPSAAELKARRSERNGRSTR